MENEGWATLVADYQEAEAAFEAANSAVSTRIARGEGPTVGELEVEESARLRLIAARRGFDGEAE